MSNWHDCMRLTLLRYFGKFGRDVRRLLIGYCERAHAKWLAKEWHLPPKLSFHRLCKQRLEGHALPRYDKLASVYYDAKCVIKYEKVEIKLYTPDEIICECCVINDARIVNGVYIK